jgi:tetratricopeptide (TPR) repeat protein
MADDSKGIAQRDFFMSFNSADIAYAAAIDAALREVGFTTFYHPNDLGPGGNIPKWMDDALMNSRQMLSLCSPEYMADGAVYSESERYARFWQDTRGSKFKLVPVVLREVQFPPLLAIYKRIAATNMTPAQAADAVIAALKTPEEIKEREVLKSVEALPKIFNALYRPNPNFTGRLEALESLQKSFREGTNAAVTAVAGLGGVGKTTLAAEYCHRFGGRYGGVWWIRAEQETVMLGDLQALGQELGVASGTNIEDDARATLRHLKSLTQSWLLVYDNAPNPDAVRKWLPTGSVRCLITSRFTAFDDIAPVTRLDQWSDAVTADYLLTRTGRDDKAGAARLAQRLGGLPLAAEQAAVFLASRKGITFDDYAAEIVRLIKQPRPAGTKGDYPDTVYAAFVKSLETLGETEAGKIALDLLRLCAFLSPDGVDLALVTVKWGAEVLPTSLATTIADKFTREDALAVLTSLSLLRQENGPIGTILIFHRLLLEVVRDWIGEDARIVWGSAAVQLISYSFPYNSDDEPSQWPLCARLMPHVALLEAYVSRTGAAGRGLDRLLNQACLYLKARGDREGALALAGRSVALVHLTRKEEPLVLAAVLDNLGSCYADLDRLEDAEGAYREVLEIKEPRLAPNDPSLAITLSNLGEVHWKREDFAAAEPLFLRAAEIMKDVYGAESAQYGNSLGNLDGLYDEWAENSGDAEKRRLAERYSEQALTISRATRGTWHPDTSTRYSNLSVLKRRLGDFGGAALDAERAVAIMLSLDLASHPNYRSLAGNLAGCWAQSGAPEKAARRQRGDISDLLPVIKQIEAEHRAWVAEDPKTRRFGPPSPFGPSKDDIAKMARQLAEAGVDMEGLRRRVQSGELSPEDAAKLVTEQLARRTD